MSKNPWKNSLKMALLAAMAVLTGKTDAASDRPTSLRHKDITGLTHHDGESLYPWLEVNTTSASIVFSGSLSKADVVTCPTGECSYLDLSTAIQQAADEIPEKAEQQCNQTDINVSTFPSALPKGLHYLNETAGIDNVKFAIGITPSSENFRCLVNLLNSYQTLFNDALKADEKQLDRWNIVYWVFVGLMASCGLAGVAKCFAKSEMRREIVDDIRAAFFQPATRSHRRQHRSTRSHSSRSISRPRITDRSPVTNLGGQAYEPPPTRLIDNKAQQPKQVRFK